MLKPINDFEGYFISDNGKVYSNLGKGNRHLGKTVDLYEIKPRIGHTGYTRVYMRQSSTNKRKDKYIHRLVAEAFIDKPLNKDYVNHKNCNRLDNRVDNLEWCTAKENTKYTEDLNHVKRDHLGRYMSNFDYKKAKIIYHYIV